MALALGGFVSTGCIDHVVGEFFAQGALNQCLLERHGGGVHRLRAHRAVYKQLISYLGMVGSTCAALGFRVLLGIYVLGWQGMPHTQNF